MSFSFGSMAAAVVTHAMHDAAVGLHIPPPDVPRRCVAATSLEADSEPARQDAHDAQGCVAGLCSAFAAACVQMARK